VQPSLAQTLARAGALVAIASLLTPWYVLEAHGLQGEGKSGIAALGIWSLVLALLALVTASSVATRIYRFLPPAAGTALALLLLAKLVSPPSAESAVRSAGGDASGGQLQDAFANALTSVVGLHYAPAWGIWLAALGAAAALVGAILGIRES